MLKGPRCGDPNGDLIHMVWRCSKLHRYWREVLSTINLVYGSSINVDPKICVLGCIDGAMHQVAHK